MSKSLRVAVQGFSAFERSTFEAFFRLSTRRTPAYELSSDLRNCHFVIADGDNPAAVAEVQAKGRLAATLLVGASPHAEAAAHVRRPINLMAVVKVLDKMHADAAASAEVPSPTPAPEARSPLPPPAPAPAPSQSQVVLGLLARAHADALQARQPVSAPPLPRRPTLNAAAPLEPLPPAPPEAEACATGPRASMDHILVVDDSDIALRFMASRLERFGFVVHLSRSGEDALVRTEQRHFAFVFMDVTMPGLDGFKTCKAIKRRQFDAGEAPPTVVMLTSRDTPIDKLRGTMAGCDGYLTKPLDENELLKLIGDREIERHEFAETARAERDA